MIFSKAQEESGVPPICVGFTYRRTSEAPGVSSVDDDGGASDTTDKLRDFTFACVGFSQRMYPYSPREEGRGAGGGGEGGKPPSRKNRLPHCAGIQALVVEKVLAGENNSDSAINAVAVGKKKKVDEDAREANKGFRFPEGEPGTRQMERHHAFGLIHGRQMQDAVEKLERDAEEQRGRSGQQQQQQERGGGSSDGAGPSQRSPAPQGNAGKLRAYLEGSKGPGYILPSAEFEQKFVKSSGKIWRNMKRHANYVVNFFGAGPGGLTGAGGRGGR